MTVSPSEDLGSDTLPAIDDVPDPLALPEDGEVITPSAFCERLSSRTGIHHVVGAEGSGAALLSRTLAAATNAPVLYVTADADRARRAAADLNYLAARCPGKPALPVPIALSLLTSETSPYSEVHPDRRVSMLRAGTLGHVACGRPWTFLVVAAPALVRRVVPAKIMSLACVRIELVQELDLVQTAERLAAAGYLRVPVVEDPGSFAIRGGILDVWSPSGDLPVRVELYGDLVQALRTFDPEDQRTLSELSELWLPPARETIIDKEAQQRAKEVMRARCDAVDYPSTKTRALVEDVASGRTFFGAEAYLPAFSALAPLWSYLPEGTSIVIEDPSEVVTAIDEELSRAEAEVAQRQGTPHFPVSDLYTSRSDVFTLLQERRTIVAHRTAVLGGDDQSDLGTLEYTPNDTPNLAIRDQADLERAVKAARTSRGKSGAFEPLVRRIQRWMEAGLAITISARVMLQAERLATLLSHRDIPVKIRQDGDPEALQSQRVTIDVGQLTRGAVAPTERLVLVTEEEIFGHRSHRPTTRKKSARAVLEDLRALTPGDYVVHVDHGIGRYIGLEKRNIGDLAVELLVVEYVGGDKLFVPVYRLNQIQKYSGGDAAPKLDRLGGTSFAKTKAKVQRQVRQMADELLRLYAERNAVKKDPLPPPDDEYATFEATFPFEETRDQANAIAEVMKDMQSDRVMDRLVCGDVGFGKTEVALRAAFRTALAGRQVALLCPTTVLAQQHYLTFSGRLAEYPIVVRPLSRFESKAEQSDTLKKLKEGSVDIVVGTHRLLSKDVHFKDLGLLVVDEEQRFGVTHKERIKQLRATVDVLTLSATPIPRTLQMAVGGLRDMSIITTPPVDRRAIRTITSRFDDKLIQEAVRRELTRGGQIFYVYNRVEGIYEKAAKLQQLVPEARVAVGHGQMGETALEQTMLEFVEGQFDVLVATAIIESGLDIPRANTIIIDRADLFGLSQLYQLRGRVGRSSERAYCYLLVPPPSQLSDEARMRIEALERYTELGSGFHIATLDMELRGAGELLGAEQSGFAASVGFDLFCRMLEEATHELRGEVVVHEVDPDLNFDVEALLPEDYVSDVGVRLSLYKRLAGALDEGEVDDVASEMQDRFGPAPDEARRFVELMRIKTELRKLRVLGCEATAKSVTLHLRDDTPLDPQKVGAIVARRDSGYRVSPDGRLSRRPRSDETFRDGLDLVEKMLNELQNCLKPAN